MIFDEKTKPMPPEAKQVFAGLIYSVWQWEQELYDGSTAIFERLKRNDTAHVVGILDDQRIMMVQDEQPDRGPVITPAGGVIENGESAEDGARREFREETGYKIGELRLWHKYRPSSRMEWEVYAYVGRELEDTGKREVEAGEKIEIKTYTFDEWLKLGNNPLMRDYYLRIMMLEAQLDKTKRDQLWKQLYE